MTGQDTVTVTEAARLLGTTSERIACLIERGVLTSRVSSLDENQQLIPREEVERILLEEGWEQRTRPGLQEPEGLSRPRPQTNGMYTGSLVVTSDVIDVYLAKDWKPRPHARRAIVATW